MMDTIKIYSHWYIKISFLVKKTWKGKCTTRTFKIDFISNNGYGIRGYYDRVIFGVNLGCRYSPAILVNTILHVQVNGRGKVI